MCKIKYDGIGDVLQILEKKYNPKRVDFFKLYSEISSLYLIAEERRVIGLEFIGFKDFVSRFYKTRKKELDFSKKAQAEEFIKGLLYNLFKTEFQHGKVLKVKRPKVEKKELTVSIRQNTVKENIKELCSV